MIFANIDGHWHKEVQSADGLIATDCGLDIPFGSEWTDQAPVEDLCSKCFPDEKKSAKKKAK
jgi:hypothetical protein